jgi:hypothetical protein
LSIVDGRLSIVVLGFYYNVFFDAAIISVVIDIHLLSIV